MILQKVYSKEEIRVRGRKLLEQVGLDSRFDHFPCQLSGGEQQRVTIARALANKPRIMLLDEPTGDLDTQNSDLIMKMLVELNMKENITMVMVTHDKGLRSLGSRVIRLVDGKIVKYETISNQERIYAI